MKFIELFAGIGGFRYGLESVGVESADQEPEQTEPEVQQRGIRASMEIRPGVLPTIDRGGRSVYSCVWSNEIDQYAAQIYRKHYGKGELHEGDITTVDAGTIPNHDLLVGGFPCQAFSIAGKRGGFEDTRGTMFFQIARICRVKRPKYLLLENVKGLLSHDEGNTYATIIATLDELGYDCQWQVLNSKNFGVPQNRERVFIIGHLRGERRPEVFPIGEGGGESDTTPREARESGERVFDYAANTLTKRDYKGGNQLLQEGVRIRRLTPTECCRLQSFPDHWVDGISDIQKYKCLGNAVTCNVIKAIGEALIDEA